MPSHWTTPHSSLLPLRQIVGYCGVCGKRVAATIHCCILVAKGIAVFDWFRGYIRCTD
jgi:hypothetical protein